VDTRPSGIHFSCGGALRWGCIHTSSDVAGVVTEGQTPDELQAHVQEALGALLEAWAELGRDLPPALRPPLADRPQAVIRGLQISQPL